MTPEEMKRLRKRLGLTQKDMAARVGCAWVTYNTWERGRHRPTGLYLRALEQLRDETKAKKA